MTTDDNSFRRRVDEVIDLTEDRAKAAATWGKQAGQEFAERARRFAESDVVREAPFAAVGLGDVVAEAARETDDEPLPDRLRRAPGDVISKVRDLGGDDVRDTYLSLAERGRVLRGKVTSDPRKGDVSRHASTAGDQARGAASAAKRGAEDVAARTGAAATDATGRAKAATSSAAKAAKSQADVARSAAAKAGATLDTGTGPLEKRTVAQLRARASELEIPGRSGMQKRELIEAIRDAT